MGCVNSSGQTATPGANSPQNVPKGAPSSTPTANPAASKPAQPAAAKPASPAAATTNLPHTLQARYKLGEILGEGGYSVVKLGVSTIDKKKVAVKIVQRAGLSHEDELSLRSEVNILLKLKHPNIVQAYDFFEEPKTFYVILEYLDGGELFDRIVKKSFYNEKEARDLVLIILNAIKYIHDMNIVHRDLKPENLLMTSKTDDAAVKLADFGFATEAAGNTIRTQCGTPGYIAPEILENKAYGKPVDMWSFGVILYILLGGYPPFHDDNQRQLFRKIIKADYQFHPDYWGGVSDEAKDLIRGLLTLDMTKRLTVDQALHHPWMKNSDDVLASRNLDSNLAELKKYQATRKLRAGVKAVMAINRMKNFAAALQSDKSSNKDSNDGSSSNKEDASPSGETTNANQM